MKAGIRIFFVLLGGILWSACGQSGGNAEAYERVALSEEMATDEVSSTVTNKTADFVAPVSYERKLTKTGVLRFETSDAKKTHAAIQHAVTETKGYVSNDNRNEYHDRVSYTVIVRVPAENFDTLLGKISSGADKIVYKHIEVLDVTQEYIDLDTRIKTKKELENRYQELLKRAHTIDEILKIEEQIGILRADIESAEGRLRYLTNQLTFSTLTVEFYEMSSVIATGFGYELKEAFRNGWDCLLQGILVVVNLWAIFLCVFVGWVIVLQLRKRRKRTSKNNV
ncbi:DUF4349 domain-containing protein [Tannerella forsythia]|uniref:DUF4349 domain-containing protein n=1 Tax=Tannerella forsythia TaxID=28112 RepID=A0A3P1YKC1_TANFO|nr:DUF4349 domain-containing protein [Tannerella forsythia]RRD71008.1 DUF4349 domain-containing protein [Tannerella forsythia]